MSAGFCWSQGLEQPAADLAAKVVAAMGLPEVSRVTVRNLSSLSPSEVTSIRQSLEAELRKRGLKPAGEGAPELRITLSENREGYLWVAEIQRGEDRQVVMASVPRPPAAATTPLASLSIERELLWESDAPVLDLVPLGETSRLVLSTQHVGLAVQDERRFWLLPKRAWPRDPRGRLTVDGSRFRAYLPGMACAGEWRPVLTGQCQESSEPWPLRAGSRLLGQGRFDPARNYFEGRVQFAGAQKVLPPFYSVAGIPAGPGLLWIFAGLDGRAQLYDSKLEPAGAFGTAGSDLASIESACGARWQVLVTKLSNENEADAVQAYEVAGGQPVAVSEPVEFPGPVTALWPAPDGTSAIAVARHLKTNRYAAFRLSISCGR